MKCPNCGLINPEIAEHCDCGYDLQREFGSYSKRMGHRKFLTVVATVLEAVGAFEGFAACGNRLESVPILAAYGAVLALLLRKRPSAVAYGTQLGLGTALSCLSLGTLILIAVPAALAVTNFYSMLGKILIAGLLNLPMISSAENGRSDLAKFRKVRAKFWLSFLFSLITASAYVFISWWRSFAVSE